MVDAPGRLDLDMRVVGEQCGEPSSLLVGEQAGAGVQGPARGVERVVLHTAVAVDHQLGSASAPVQGVASWTDDMEWIHDRCRIRKLFSGGGLEAGEAIHCDHVHGVAPSLVAVGEPGLERLFGTALDHVEQPGGACAIANSGEVNDHRDVLVASVGVPPDVLFHPVRGYPEEPTLIVNQYPLAFGQDRVVGSVPCDRQPLGDSGDGQVLTHERLQRPLQRSA